ncbi:TPA: hypothetical protein U1199_000476 [Streptococcus suis]|nr:hypothetical protein [Streptococcus suis]HEM5046285.1 hypothetical protein [Streptococcus suis]HEM5265549.1 hypothetical protein [Streptococcus suis]
MSNIFGNSSRSRYVMNKREKEEAKIIIADHHKRTKFIVEAVLKHRENIIRKAEEQAG